MDIILLQASPAGGSGSNMVFIMIIFLVFMIFFTYLPNRKMKKEQAKFLEEMKKGDEVVTNGGMIGKVTKVDEKTITIEISPKNYVTVLLSSVSKQLSEDFKK